MSLLQAIEMVAKDKGIDKTRLVKTVEEAILKAAQSVFGPNRELEATLQRGHRPGRPLPVHDRRRRRVGRASARSRSRTRRSTGSRRSSARSSASRSSGTRTTRRRPPSRTRSSAISSSVKQARAVVRPHRRADREAGAHPARARRRARPHLQRVQGPQGRAHQGRRPPLREGQQHHRRPRPHRGHPAVPRADAARDVPPGRPHRRLREGHRPRGARPAGHPVARRSASSSRSSSRPRCPEIYEGIVRIVACAREPGARSKIAVTRATRTSIRWARASA